MEQYMEELSELLNDILNRDLIRAVLSNPREKDGVTKIKVRPVEAKGVLCFQVESFTEKQAFQENLAGGPALLERLLCAMENFRQMQIETTTETDTVLVSKKRKLTIKRKKHAVAKEAADMGHNRKKRYIMEEGIPVPFLQDLGVMTKEGKIVRTKMDKFRQMNRFLEFIEDILPKLDQTREMSIIDFGCGKSYLTFAMYYYLHELRGYDIKITGLDLKKDVIARCSELASRYGYEKLRFLVGDIADYDGTDHVDMVVTLHACDTATDYALAKAVGWGAEVILSVPCCQHELNAQLSGKSAGGALAPVMDYGILKERFAALITDGLRAKYLEQEGYETQVLEFIDMEHTPKNILIRAVRRQQGKKGVQEKISSCEELLGIDPVLGKLLLKKGE